MNKKHGAIKNGIFAVLLVLVVLIAWIVIADVRNERNGGGSFNVEGNKGGSETKMRTKSLTDFCNDEGLNRWFNDIDKDTPVKLNYMIYGVAPVMLEFTDRDIILKTVEALKTVMIDGESSKNPDYVLDAGGHGYSFIMEDGSNISFSFVLGCFRWARGKWHNVASFGQLAKVNDELREIGIKEHEFVYARDGGFYTKVLETYKTEWKQEDGFAGGLHIYVSEKDETTPSIEICRCETTAASPKEYLEGELDTYMRAQIEKGGATLLEAGKVEEYKNRRKTIPSVLYTAELPEDQGGGKIYYKNLALLGKDHLLGESCIVRFCAAYREDDKDAVLNELDWVISEFYFKYKYYEKKEVQPNNYLVDFINDDRIRTWFDGIDNNMPDTLIYTTKSWEDISDPEQVRQILKAIQTVKIGELNKTHVGASGRRHYDFIYNDSGEGQSFMFYGDVFSWKGEEYDVLDWGDLKKLF